LKIQVLQNRLIIEDPSPGFGQITILCLENAWTYFEAGIGDESMAEFFCNCDADYLADKFLPQVKHRLLLKEKIIPTVKKALKQLAPNGSKCEFYNCKILK
jgi:hypothetical protein